MKQLRRITLMVLILALLLSVCGCTKKPEAVTDPAITEPAATEDSQKLAQMYESAVEAVTSDTLTLNITYDKKVTVAEVSYHESGKLTQNYWNVGTDDFLAKVKQTVTFGNDDYEIEMEEIYSGGKVYQELGKQKYMAEISADSFMEQYVPVKMLEPSLYTLSLDETKSCISFQGATAGEAWLLPEGASMNSASGSAQLSSDGKLTETTYTVDYRYGSANILMTYRVSVAAEGRKPELPESEEGYVLLDHISAAYAMEHTYGYLNQARHVSYSSRALTMSAAGGVSVQQNVQTDVYAIGQEYAAKCVTTGNINHYATGNNADISQTEKFIDGKYTRTIGDGREEPNSAVSQVAMEAAITKNLVSLIQIGSQIAQVETTDLGSLILFEYTGTEKFGEAMCYSVSTSLFGSGDVLNQIASDYETKDISFYLALDKYSLLPTAMGANYEGVHTIEGQSCILSHKVDNAYDLASLSAYDAVFDQPEPENAPENPATPLFYRVTGADGQEMWLLGTIHVGDARTAFLPDEIYDAFHASDALAVECNAEAFYEQAEKDDALSEQISHYYFYSDGSTAGDHIDTPELYDAAIQMLKATGEYFYNTEYMKVNLLSSSLDNFYIRQGYQLTGEKGVDNRLLALAEEEDMPIKEVESTLFQIQMTSDYSEHLQEVMLYSTLASDAQSSWKSTAELYELWCQGDEAGLKKMLVDEPWEITEEDFPPMEELTEEEQKEVQAILDDLENINAQLKVLQEEYNQAMSYSRNEKMVEVAKEYLESGETVFYAVGLAHLLAENGLVNGLREAGYTVELVSYQ